MLASPVYEYYISQIRADAVFSQKKTSHISRCHLFADVKWTDENTVVY